VAGEFQVENPYSSPNASVDMRPRTRRSKESGNENYFKTARAHMALACLAFLGLGGMATALALSEKSLAGQTAVIAFALAVVAASVAFHLAIWWGAKRRKGWARVLSIISGVLSLPGFPVGTLIGVYLIYLAWSKWQEPEYYESITLEGWPGQPAS
jgi:glycerol-3-phosphate acyltransferase PlsY